MHTVPTKGFTLVELVIVLTMLAVMAAVAAPYMTRAVQAYNNSSAAVQTLGKVRNASERLVRELRAIRRLPSGNYDVTVGANPLVFTKTDGETVTVNYAPPLVTLTYASVSGVTPTLTDEVSNLTFNYWQSDGSTPATGGDNVAYIEFELILDPGTAATPWSHRGRVALRNQE